MSSAHKFDNLFFSGMAALIFAAVFAGFARTYYLAGVFRAPLPSLLIHIHGAAFSAWILLLIVQTSLVASGRANLHRRLGIYGFGLAALMVILGLLAAAKELTRHATSPALAVRARRTYILPVTDMTLFATFIYAGYRQRFQPSAHKRLMLAATVAILDAAILRWPVPVWWWDLQAAQMFCYAFLLMLAGYDLWSMRRIHRGTLWASLLIISIQQVRTPVGGTALWQTFATWVQNHSPV